MGNRQQWTQLIQTLKQWAGIGQIPAYYYHGDRCRGCDLRLLASLSPAYDLQNAGIKLQAVPEEAHLLICCGPITVSGRRALALLYDRLRPPRYLLAIGNCPLTGGPLRDGRTIAGGIDELLPVDLYVPGCPPQPDMILHGLSLVRQKMCDRLTEAQQQLHARETDKVVPPPPLRKPDITRVDTHLSPNERSSDRPENRRG